MTDPLKILVIEDDPGLSQLVAMLLGSDPRVGEVVVMNDGTDALTKARELQPDVVVLDTGVPGDGEVIGPKLRETLPNIRLISFSGFDRPAPWADVRIVKGGDAAEQLTTAIFGVAKESDYDAVRRFLHDLRNPLGAILGFTHLLEDRGRLTDEQLEQVMAGIKRSALRMSEILDSFSEQHKRPS
ncbi:MAG TPA: histidine kinase dimerization/phospho-acceptor domain-containing protein [Actinomycetota bacterium]|nr:histidine kinase dimerization/phospho-acceptor domain-containing protein [Actinomycetota bacterium]